MFRSFDTIFVPSLVSESWTGWARQSSAYVCRPYRNAYPSACAACFKGSNITSSASAR